ncbi:MAG: hypothetical protein ACREEM_14605 [Blastocatellia bacterium]
MKAKSDNLADKLLPAIEPVLRGQQITETEPGPVVRDFEAFMDFFASRDVLAGGKNDLLPMAALAELNARMTRPIEIRLKRPMQKSSILFTAGTMPAGGLAARWSSMLIARRYCLTFPNGKTA